MKRSRTAKVIRRHKYADVDFDMYAESLWLTAEGERRLAEVWQDYGARLRGAGRRMKGLFAKHGRSSGTFRVLRDNAQAIQQRIERILNDADCVYAPERYGKAVEAMARLRAARRGGANPPASP
jgi:hypothetical protein